MEPTSLKSLPLLKRGKVRDIYDLGKELLIVATDRISCFDVVLPTPIPGKGKVLTSLSNFWFEKTNSIIKNHLSPKTISDIISNKEERAKLENRSAIVKKVTPLPLEAIVRGYLSGSAWEEYKKAGTVCGYRLGKGLTESSKLPLPIFTPSTKAKEGAHDENIPFSKLVDIIEKDLAERVKDVSLAIYRLASEHALAKGIIIADTKFEFGISNEGLILIDEVLTPDSSRFWPADEYSPGKAQKSYDKQFVRDYLLSVNWNKEPPAPELPAQIVAETTEKYNEALKRLKY